MSIGLLIVLGGVGALIPDAIKLVEGRFNEFPDWVKRLSYWIPLGIMVVIGAGLAVLFDPETAVPALALGYSGPSILQRLLSDRSVLPEAARGGRTQPTQAADDKAAGGDASPVEPAGGTIRSVRQWWAL